MKPESRKLIFTLCRIALGAVFIFSGGMKCLDMWGTAQKVGDYLAAFGMERLLGLKVAIAVTLSAVEFAVGLMLVTGTWRRMASLAALVFMAVFTLLTLGVAIWDPLDECGCFGEAIRISNWNSFFKNVALLALSMAVWRSAGGGKLFSPRREEAMLTVVFLCVPLIAGTLVYRHLPPVDMFPYKTGNRIGEDVICTACMDKSVTLVYRDRQTGLLREFTLEDTEWYDGDRWEYVETLSAYDLVDRERLDEDFALFSGDRNIAAEIAFYEGRTVMAVLNDPAALDGECGHKMEIYLAAQQDARVVVIIPKGDGDAAPETIRMGTADYPVFTMEPKTLGHMLRADAGVVTMENGVITGKKACRDI